METFTTGYCRIAKRCRRLLRYPWNHRTQHDLYFVLQTAVIIALCLPIAPIHARTRQEILRGLLINNSESQYDSSMPPHYDEDVPANVTVQIYVLSFDSVTETSMVNKLATTSYLKYSQQDPSPITAATDGLLPVPRSTQNGHRSNRGGSAFGNKQRNFEEGSAQEHRGFEFSMSIFLRQNWTDPRLRWADPLVHDRLEVDPKMMNAVWVPDLYFVNEREAVMHDVTVANKLLHIDQNGSVVYSVRISMTLSCDMFLDRYPHDEQSCSLCLGSYSFSKDNVAFKWMDSNPIVMRPEMTLPRFQVRFQKVKECDFLFTEDSTAIIGDYSCIQADFHLRREFGYYIAQVYVPSVLIVMLSWVSFWIDIEATPARVSLGLLTVLTITTQSTGEKAALPRVSYIKAMDVWMSTCLFFVFAALLEFAYVNVQSRVEKRRRQTHQCNFPVPQEGERTNPLEKDVKVPQPVNTIFRGPFVSRDDGLLKHQKARSTDKISRVAFPVAFFIFNLVYWIYYR